MHISSFHSISLTACCLALSGLAPAAHAETPLDITLGPGYTQRAGFDFTSIDAPAGRSLTFSLLGEATGWAAKQTFSVVDGGETFTIFSGPATAGAQFRYVVRNGLRGVLFASNSGNAQQFAPGGSDADDWVLSKTVDGTTAYAFAYEDYHYGSSNDHNDMVVGLAVTPAVPETGTLALMLSGLGVVALRFRSRFQPGR